MPGQRAKDKRRFEGWVLADLYDRVRAAARARVITDTDALVEALTDWADKHETASARSVDATGTANREITDELRGARQEEGPDNGHP